MSSALVCHTYPGILLRACLRHCKVALPSPQFFRMRKLLYYVEHAQVSCASLRAVGQGLRRVWHVTYIGI